jgi:hypothetical protein
MTAMTASGLRPTAVAVGADPPAQQPPPPSPRCGPAGKGRQLWQHPHTPPQGRGRRSALCGPAAGTRVAHRGVLWEANWARDALGRTPLKLVRAYSLMAPDKAETEGAWVWRWDTVAGGAGADWATCLCLLECATATTNVACSGAALTVALSTRVGWGISLFWVAN